jgi:hypothetical protein
MGCYKIWSAIITCLQLLVALVKDAALVKMIWIEQKYKSNDLLVVWVCA